MGVKDINADVMPVSVIEIAAMERPTPNMGPKNEPTDT